MIIGVGGEICSTCAYWPQGPLKWELVPFPQDKAAGLYLTPFHVPSWHATGWIVALPLPFYLDAWVLHVLLSSSWSVGRLWVTVSLEELNEYEFPQSYWVAILVCVFLFQLLFARGSLVELLISSNIARYAEFRSVTRVLTWLDGRLQPVPCSRADVFATHHVTVVEKRMLMKLLTVCMEYESSSKEFEGAHCLICYLYKYNSFGARTCLIWNLDTTSRLISIFCCSWIKNTHRPVLNMLVIQMSLIVCVCESLSIYLIFCLGFEDRSFLEYLKSKKLTPNLVHYVLYAIAMATDNTPCMEGVACTQRFLNSLGRYGNTPFLWPMYGSGEIPQCFCR